jgi:riboflavin synthase
LLTDARLGDSIAVNGVDLTIAEIVGDTFVAHVMPETHRRSNSGRLKPRERVNLERSLRQPTA